MDVNRYIEPLTDSEKRIFLAAMFREKEIWYKIDCISVSESYEDSLTYICNEIERKVKNALWK